MGQQKSPRCFVSTFHLSLNYLMNTKQPGQPFCHFNDLTSGLFKFHRHKRATLKTFAIINIKWKATNGRRIVVIPMALPYGILWIRTLLQDGAKKV